LANNEQALYKGVAVNWSRYINANQTFVIDATVHLIILITRICFSKCKDAIVDQFRERTGQRPSIDKVHPDLRINIHMTEIKYRLP
jgi:putative N6-adenine-specific DNA methylase